MRRPERAQNEGSTGPKRLDDTRRLLAVSGAVVYVGVNAKLFVSAYIPSFLSVLIPRDFFRILLLGHVLVLLCSKIISPDGR